MTTEMITTIAHLMPEREIVKMIHDYSQNMNDLDTLKSTCMLLLLKDATGNTLEGLEKFTEKVSKMRQRENLFNTSQS